MADQMTAHETVIDFPALGIAKLTPAEQKRAATIAMTTCRPSLMRCAPFTSGS
jgi:hypothetical protein